MNNYSRFKLMIMLIAFIIVGSNTTNMFAAIQSITVGNNTIPDNNWPATNQPSAVSSAIYTRAELGNLADAIISKLALYVQSTNNPNGNSIDNVYILLRNTTATSAELPVIPCGMSGINALVSNGFQIVKGPFTIRGSQLIMGWNDFNFTMPFKYTGTAGSNLQVVIATVEQKNTLPGTVNGFNVGTYYNTTGLTRPSAFYGPNNYCQAITMQGQTQNVKPYIRLEVETTANPGQQYVSANCSQSLITIAASGETYVPIIRVEINIHNNEAPFNNLTAISFDSKNSNSFVTWARLYYSGTNHIFNTSAGTFMIAAIPVGGDVNIPIDFDGLDMPLEHGTNYFWLAYDVAEVYSDAYLDAALESFTLSINGKITNFTNGDPAGEVYVKPNNATPITLNESKDKVTGEYFVGNAYTTSYQYNGNFGYFSTTTYARTFGETIYRPNEISITPGPITINNIAWQIGTAFSPTAGTSINGISIWLKESDTTYLAQDGLFPDTSESSGYVKVLDNATIPLSTGPINDWFVFNFDIPFEYSGNNNLVMLIVRNTQGSLTGTGILYTRYYYAYYDSPTISTYTTKMGYGSQTTTTWTIMAATSYPYKAYFCINKYEDGKLCTRSGVHSGDNDAVTSKTIRASDSSYAHTQSYTYFGYWTYYSKNVANWIYQPKSMGSTANALGNCPRDITGLDFLQNYRYYGATTIGAQYNDPAIIQTYPTEIWMRNTSETQFSTTTTTDPPYLYYPALASNGFVKVFTGTIDMTYGCRRYHIDFDTPFEYDGTSSVEVLLYSWTPGQTYHNTTTTHYCYFSCFYYNSTTYNSRYYYTSASAATLGTSYGASWSSVNYYLPDVEWYYESKGQRLQDITTNNLLQTQVTSKEYTLFRVDVSNNDQTCAPHTLNGFKIRLNNSDNVKINKINVYSGDDPVLTYNPVPITSAYNIEGDLVKVTFPSITLNPLQNVYYITVEVSEETNCNSSVGGSLYSVIVSDKDYDSRYFYTTVPSNTSVDYSPIRLLDRGADKICINKVDSVYTVSVMGNVNSFQWSLWNRNTSNFEEIPGATSDHINIYTDSIINGNNRARVVAIPPPGSCSEPASLDLSFSVTVPTSGAYTTLNDYPTSQTDTLITCYGEETMLVGHCEGDVYRYQWQYLDGYGQWQNISMADVLTSTQDTMYFIPNARFRNTMLRFVAYSDPACDDYTASTPFPVKAFAKNYFDIHPPKTVNLCRGDRLYVSAIYVGEPAISTRWYKDGFPLEYNVDPILDISKVDFLDAGTYWYEVVSIDCEGLATIRSNEVQLFINPEPHIINQPTNIRANLNEPALIKIDANYYYDGSYDNLFKWFRYDGIKNISIPLTENNKTQGTLSNILTIIPIDERDYTYNGDYYYCEIYNLCDPTSSFVRSKPIFLLPEYKVIITRDPESVELCTNILPTTLTFRVYAYSVDDPTQIFYQWYEIDNTTTPPDTNELATGGNYTGVNTSTLIVSGVNVDPTSPTPQYGKSYYCKAWYYGDNPYDPDKYVVSETANISFSHPVDQFAAPVDISYYIGETAALDATDGLTSAGGFYTINAIEWFYVVGGIYQKINTSPMTSILNINNISIYQAGTYVAIIYTTCNIVDKTFNVVVSDPSGEVNTVVEENNVDIQISPNPASNLVNIAFTAIQDSKYNIEITDITGVVVYSLNGTTNLTNNIILDTDEQKLTSGSYIFNLFVDGKKTTKSFIIAK